MLFPQSTFDATSLPLNFKRPFFPATRSPPLDCQPENRQTEWLFFGRGATDVSVSVSTARAVLTED